MDQQLTAVAAPAGREAEILARLGALAWEVELPGLRLVYLGAGAATVLDLEGPLPPDAWDRLVHPGDREAVDACRARARTADVEDEQVFRLLTPAGRELTVREQFRVVRDGAQRRLVGLWWPVAERPAVLARDQAVRAQVLQSLTPAWIYNVQTFRFLEVNAAAAHYFGYSREMLLEMSATEVRSPAEADRLRAYFQDFPADGSQAPFRAAGRWRYTRRDGSTAFAEAEVQPLRYQGQPAALVFARDVTAHLHAENTLQRTEQLLANVLAHAPLWVFALNPAGVVTLAAGRGMDTLGMRAEELVGRSVHGVHGGSPQARELINRALSGAATQGVARLGTRAFEIHFAAERDAAGAVTAVLGVAVDLSERIHAEDALRAQTARYEALLQAQSDVGEGFLVMGRDGARALHVNDAFCALTGYTREELLALPSLLALLPPEEQERVRAHAEAIAAGRLSGPVDGGLLHRSGRRVDVEAALKPYTADGTPQYVGVVRDVTARRRAEAVLHETQRHQSLAVVTGGLAHDFNNLLGVILGHAGMAALQVPEDSPVRPWLSGIETAGLRAAELCSQMLAFSGRNKMERRSLDLNTLVQETLKLLGVSLSRQLRLRPEWDARAPSVEGDGTGLRQVVMNLVLNANEAVGNAPGTLGVRTGILDADAAALAGALPSPGLRAGRYAFLEVQDSGCGMDSATLERIFDPYFTTKPSGRGLGLAVVLGVVRAHHGAVQVDSQPGAGTTFRVLLPLAQAAAETPRLSRDAPWRAQGAVLVADRDAASREAAAEGLRLAGFTVLTAPDGQAALDAFQSHAAILEAVVLDAGLGAPSAADVLGVIHQHRPDLRVLVMGSAAEERAGQELLHRGGACFLAKPCAPALLLSQVRQMLQPAAAGSASSR